MTAQRTSDLDVQRIDTGAVTRLALVWSEAEWRQINQYLESVDEIAKTPIMKAGFGVHMEVSLGSGTGHGITTRLPAMDDVRLLLHKLRPLILQQEPASFLRTRKLLKERLANESVRAILDASLKLYDGRVSRSVVKIELNRKLLNSEEFLDSWLNAHEYHRDADKQKEIAELDAAYPAEGSRAIWISMLVDKCKAILNVAGLVACIIGRQTEISDEVVRVRAVPKAAD